MVERIDQLNRLTQAERRTYPDVWPYRLDNAIDTIFNAAENLTHNTPQYPLRLSRRYSSGR